MRSFKPSRAPWLAEIPADWTEAPLFTYFRESKRKNAGMAETNVLSLSYGEIKRRDVEAGFGLLPESFETYQIVEPGNIVMRLTDLQNDQRSLRTGLVTERGIITSAYVALAPEPRVDERFARYLLHVLDTMKVFYGLGAGVRQTMNYGDLSGIPLALPPKLIQGAIADYLDSETARIDSLIDRKQRFVDLLLEKRDTLITHAVTRGLDPMAEMRDSGIEWIGAVPAHWRIFALRRVTVSCCDGPFGSGLKNDHYAESGVRVVRLGNIGACAFKDDDAAYVDKDHAAALGDHSVLANDVLIAGLGDDNNTVGRACVAPDLGPAIVKADCFRFRMSEDVLPSFVAHFLSATARAYASGASTGSTRNRVNLTRMMARPIAAPPIVEQQQIVAHLDRTTSRIDSLISKTRRSIELLREYRTALISAAVTGQIDIPAASPSEEVA